MTVTASNFERKHLDLYETEKWAVEALLRQFPLSPGRAVWEPAAGNHRIAEVLIERGARVVTSDITTYDRPHAFLYDFFLYDFLRPSTKPMGAMGCEQIVTNPPYGKGNRDAVTFAELALMRCDGLVALLLTAKFDFGKTRQHLFRDNPRFAAKIALVDRIQWFAGASTGTEDHAWYVWRSKHAPWSAPRLFWEGKT